MTLKQIMALGYLLTFVLVIGLGVFGPNIGYSALLQRLLFPIIWAPIMLSLGIQLVLKKGAALPRTFKVMAGIGVFVLVGCVVIAFSHSSILQIRTFRELRTLTPSDVRSIRVEGKELLQSTDIVIITEALHGNQFYEVNHGGWDRTVPMEVRLTNGETLHLQLGKLGSRGAVMGIVENERYPVVYLFSSELPSALEKVGSPLPSDPIR